MKNHLLRINNLRSELADSDKDTLCFRSIRKTKPDEYICKLLFHESNWLGVHSWSIVCSVITSMAIKDSKYMDTLFIAEMRQKEVCVLH